MPAAGKRALLATGVVVVVVVVAVGVVVGVVVSGFGKVAGAVVLAVAAVVVGCLARRRVVSESVLSLIPVGLVVVGVGFAGGAVVFGFGLVVGAVVLALATGAAVGCLARRRHIGRRPVDSIGDAEARDAAVTAARDSATAASGAEATAVAAAEGTATGATDITAAAEGTATSATAAALAAADVTAPAAPVPPAPLDLHIGRHRIATRYLSASPDAVLGGDLFDIVDSPYGLRVIVGDARGHGAVAVRLAAATVAAFRTLAPGTPRLPDLAARVDAAIGSRLGAEDFVTVVLAEFAPGEVRLVNCGHPAPLRLGARFEALEPAEPVPPLGLHPVPRQQRYRLAAGERLLLYTDGLSEARDAQGVMFPLDARVRKALGGPLLHDCLDALHTLVAAHTAGPLTDDLALLICEPRAAPVDVPCPPPEAGCDQASGGGSSSAPRPWGP
ncbi:PP2C family protein-serine/threonine phosphatase [Actinomycetota bacterium Odt1-20B]